MNQNELFSSQELPINKPTAPARVTPVYGEIDDLEESMPGTRSTYLARLTDYPHPTADIVKVAEQRFRRELEKHLGDDVLRAQRAYVSVTEASEADLTKDEVILATRWTKAYAAARDAGFRDLGDTAEAYFEIRPI